MKRSILVVLTTAALMFAIIFSTPHLSVAINSGWGIVKGVNGQWPIIQCGSSSTPQQCSEHWVIGSGSQDPPSGYGENGDLFWRTDLTNFRVKSAGSWTAWSAAGQFPMLAPDGSVGAPSYSFSGLTSSGLYRVAGAGVAIASGGSQVMLFPGSGNIQSSTGIRLPDGTASTPAINWTNSATSGLWYEGSSTWGWSFAGSDILRWSNNQFEVVNGRILISATVFSSLGTPSNGSLAYCSDCTIANPCASGGSGAIAKRLNSVWVCN